MGLEAPPQVAPLTTGCLGPMLHASEIAVIVRRMPPMAISQSTNRITSQALPLLGSVLGLLLLRPARS